MNCQSCSNPCIKAGKQPNGKQKYYCKNCRRYQQLSYPYSACEQKNRLLFIKCLQVGNSLRGIQSITGISMNTQLRWIRELGKTIKPPNTFLPDDTYELDELCTYVGNKNKRRWVVSAISRTTGSVVDVVVGARTKANLKLVVDKLLALSPKAIYTDRLQAYGSLIPKHLHQIKRRGINKIERYHLNLRTHIKRLNRRTICFSKKLDLLCHLVKIYAWGT